MAPEVVNYRWYLRSDGKSTFAEKDSMVSTGSVTGATKIAFGPFSIDWSTAGTYGGYLYYPTHEFAVKLPMGYWVINLPGGPRMAITTEEDVTKLDARDRRWKFHR